ncbi:MAG TPA: tetratricopeptide repeat protein [Pyrinomonadaceae bacterium]|nr:tetratricopeptide repeat protein [Pyrinomonadaceae bacterium]
MAQNHTITPIYRYSVLLMLLIFSAAVAHAQSGGGIDTTGTGGRHAISGRLIFPSGQRANYQLKIKLETNGEGDLTVMSDINGNFSFRSLTAGTYTVVIEGDHFETVRESVFIEPYNTSPAPGVRLVPVSRPITLQIYLRPKQILGAQTKPGVINAALAGVPKAAVALYEKGLQFVSNNERDKAIDEFKRAVELHANFGLALNELGAQYMKKGELDKAEEALTKAYQLLPDSPDVVLNYGILLLQKKKFADAEVQLRDAVKKNDSAYTAHLYFGITLIYVKKYEEAETELQKAVTIGGEKASQAHYYLGGLYWQTGKNRQAADELEKFLKLEPKAPNADKLRGTIKELRNKSE